MDAVTSCSISLRILIIVIWKFSPHCSLLSFLYYCRDLPFLNFILFNFCPLLLWCCHFSKYWFFSDFAFMFWKVSFCHTPCFYWATWLVGERVSCYSSPYFASFAVRAYIFLYFILVGGWDGSSVYYAMCISRYCPVITALSFWSILSTHT